MESELLGTRAWSHVSNIAESQHCERSRKLVVSGPVWPFLLSFQASNLFFCCYDSDSDSDNVTSLCSPNEDFGRVNKTFDEFFRSIFQWLVAQIEYSHPLKVVRRDPSNGSFGFPKSSFGEHKVRRSASNRLFIIPQSSFGEHIFLLATRLVYCNVDS